MLQMKTRRLLSSELSGIISKIPHIAGCLDPRLSVCAIEGHSFLDQEQERGDANLLEKCSVDTNLSVLYLVMKKKGRREGCSSVDCLPGTHKAHGIKF